MKSLKINSFPKTRFHAGSGVLQRSSLGNRFAAILLGLSIPFSGWICWRETQLWLLDQRVLSAAQQPKPWMLHRLRSQADDCGQGCGPRYRALAAGAYAALSQADEPPSQRDAYRRAALSTAADLVRNDPRSGMAWALFAYAASLQPERTGCACTELAQSYRYAPYLREQALWRISYGAAHWQELAVSARNALLREALWYEQLGKADKTAVTRVLEGTAPYLTVALRAPGLGAEAAPLPSEID